jgi:hypothetical protein
VYLGDYDYDRARALRLFATIRQAWAVRIYFNGPPLKDITCTLDEILNSQLPFLRTFLYKSVDRYALSSKFLGGAPVSLTKLILEHVHLASEAPVFPSLLYLELRRIWLAQGMKQLLDLLEKAPRLKHLHTRVVRVVSHHTPNDKFRPINLPRLATVHIEDCVGDIGALIDILPLPQCEYHAELILGKYPAEPDDVMTNQRTEDFQRAFHKFGLHKHSPPSPVVHLSKTHFGGDFFELTLVHSDVSGRKMTYKDGDRRLVLFNPILDELEMLHLQGNALQEAGIYAAIRPEHAFARLEHLVIEDGHGGLLDLLTWLRSRAAVGRRLRVIDFMKCEGFIQESDTMKQLKDDLLREELVEEVLEDGHAL